MNEITLKELPYRKGVGIVIINSTGEIFVGRRLDMNRDVWQMPQGGIEEGELPETAAKRELEEETSIKWEKVYLLSRSQKPFRYELPSNLAGKVWSGRYRGQEQLWFAVKFIGKDKDINISTKYPEFDSWCWMNHNSILSQTVSFKRELYENVFREFSGLIS